MTTLFDRPGSHQDHAVHANSRAAYRTLDHKGRLAEVMRVYAASSVPLTDHEVMVWLGRADPNAVRPRITEAVKAGLLEEVGKIKCHVTKRMVRLCRRAK